MTLPLRTQAAAWNGPSGQAWAQAQAILDPMFQPFADLLAAVAPAARKVLDIGCGAGALSRAIGPQCTGIDISEVLLDLARRLTPAGGPRFLHADLEAAPLAESGYDLLLSRFGVMFFEDPVLAFRRLRVAAAPGALLCAIAWRDPQQNPFMTAAEHAAEPLLPSMPARRLDAPGQFAFARPEYVLSILQASGWRSAQIDAIDVVCQLPVEHLDCYLGLMGPVGQALAALPQETRGPVLDRLRHAFDRFREGDMLRYTAACWQITARAGDEQ